MQTEEAISVNVLFLSQLQLSVHTKSKRLPDSPNNTKRKSTMIKDVQNEILRATMLDY